MDFSLSRNWWVLLLRGVVAILFGVAAFLWPGPTLYVLVLLFGAYALLDGLFALFAAMSGHFSGDNLWALLLEGIIGIGVGIVTFAWPGVTGLALLYLIAFWAITTGVFEIVAAFRLPRHIGGGWLLALSGLLSVLFGVLLVIAPGEGALAVIWLIAAYAISFGILLVALSLQLAAHRAPRTRAF